MPPTIEMSREVVGEGISRSGAPNLLYLRLERLGLSRDFTLLCGAS